MTLLFLEPSTRTSSSFAAAMQRLGGAVNHFTPATSSTVKGESLEDTVRCLQSYSDVLVVRHPEAGAAARVAATVDLANTESSQMLQPLDMLHRVDSDKQGDCASSQRALPHGQCVVMNAGDGAGEHPTQALVDVFTMLCEITDRKQPRLLPLWRFERLSGFTVTLLGDMKFGRTTHSLAQALGTVAGANSKDGDKEPALTVVYVAPSELAMPTDIITAAAAAATAGADAKANTKTKTNAKCDAVAASSPNGVTVSGLCQRIADISALTSAPKKGVPCLLAQTDVLYVTRVQKERFPSEDAWQQYQQSVSTTAASSSASAVAASQAAASSSSGYCITPELLKQGEAKPTLRVLHPLPRVDEVPPALEATEPLRAAYMRQMRWGLYLRMALIAEALGATDEIEALYARAMGQAE